MANHVYRSATFSSGHGSNNTTSSISKTERNKDKKISRVTRLTEKSNRQQQKKTDCLSKNTPHGCGYQISSRYRFSSRSEKSLSLLPCHLSFPIPRWNQQKLSGTFCSRVSAINRTPGQATREGTVSVLGIAVEVVDFRIVLRGRFMEKRFFSLC